MRRCKQNTAALAIRFKKVSEQIGTWILQKRKKLLDLDAWYPTEGDRNLKHDLSSFLT